jgi:2-dehydropantoate 2-reductase
VVGAGAIGCLLAAELSAAGQDVIVCARRPFARLVVERDGTSRDLPATVVTAPEQAPPADWVVVALKAHDSAAAQPWVAALGGKVVAVQNGIEHRERFGPQALPAIVYAGTERLADGHVVHRLGNRLIVPDEPAGRAFAPLLDGSVLDVETVADFRTAAWRKLFSNLAGNPLTALTGGRMAIFGDPAIRELALGLLREALAVGRAEGAALADDEPERTLALFDAMPPEGGSSMLYDRLAGRPLEYDALTGALVRAAERHGIDVPLNRAILALLGALRP